MSRVAELSGFMVRDLFRSLQGAVPPILTLGLYQATFVYSGSVDYFASVGGVDLMLVDLVITLLFVSRLNRAVSYPLLARLPRRSIFLAALVTSALVVTVAMAVLFTGLALAMRKVMLGPEQAILISVRWLVLFVFTTALGLNAGKLASRGGSYLVVIGLIALMATVGELQVFLPPQLDGLVRAIAFVVNPLRVSITTPVARPVQPEWLAGLAILLAWTAGLLALAVTLFRTKDLNWAE